MSNHQIRAEAAELSVLALVLRDPDVLADAKALGLRAASFQSMYHRAIWSGFVQDKQQGWDPDEVTLTERWAPTAGKHGSPFPSADSLRTWTQSAHRRAAHRKHLGQYVEQVLLTARARELLERAEHIIGAGDAGDSVETARDVLASAGDFVELAGRPLTVERSALRWMDEIVSDYVKEQLAIRKGDAPDTRIQTGLISLDREWRLGPGEISIVAGRPGMGKTQFALTLLRNIARIHGQSGLCSIEMGGPALARRAVSSEVRESASLVEWEQGATQAMSAWARESTPVVCDTRSRRLDEVLGSVRTMAITHGCRFVAVDYLQRLKLPSAAREDIAISEAVNTFAETAKNLNVHIQLLAQLNRGVEARPDKRPRLSDLKGASGIEDAADWIFFLYRDAYYQLMAGEAAQTPHILEVNAAKARFGAVGARRVLWTPGAGYIYDPLSEGFE